MNIEADLVPYQVTHVPKGPYLILAPHPDDEVLGMGGTIALARKQNINVHVVCVTNGAKGGDFEVRRKEFLKSLEILNVKNTHFLNLEDRDVVSSTLLEEKLEHLIGSIKPAILFLPSIQEFHPDHRATTLKVWRFLRKWGNFDGKIWLYEITRQSEINKLIDITSVIENKRKAIAAHSSQVFKYSLLDVAIAINKARSYTLERNVEYAEGFYELDRDECLIYPRLLSYIDDFFATKQPLVSVIIRTKDRAVLLKEAIESIIAQTYSRIEIIVVNDGGEDVKDVIEVFEASGKDIKYIHLPKNVGRSRAGNVGLENARGEYVCFLDDDDVFYVNHVETLVEAVKNSGFHVVYSDTERAKYVFVKDEKRQLLEKELYFSQDFSFHQLLLENFIPLNCLLFKKTVIDRAGGFDDSFDLYEDWDLLIRCARICNFYHVKKVTSEYRIWHKSQITQSQGASFQELKAYSHLLEKHKELITPEVIFSYFQLSGSRKGEILRLKNEKERQLETFKKELGQKDSIISDLNVNISLLKSRQLELEHIIQERDRTISSLNGEIQQLLHDKTILISQLNEIKESLGWRYLRSIRNLFNRIAPPNTRRGRFLFLARRTVNVYLDEGIRGVKTRIRYRLKNKKIPNLQAENTAERDWAECGFAQKKPIDIIIPVYNALSELKECLKSIEHYSDIHYNNLILVDDKSPNKDVRKFLNAFKNKNSDKNVIVIFNEKNLGFSASLNKALKYSRNDCIILNSDTLVTPKWIEKLQRAAYSRPLVGTVTPFSNHAFICSFPRPLEYNFLPNEFTLEGFSKALEEVSLFYYPEIPFGSGFCMYIKRKLIENIGYFDSELFGRGYGEDTDFCLRAAKAGYKNILDDATYIYHKGGASFESSKDPEKLRKKNEMIRENLEKLEARYPEYHNMIKKAISDLSFVRDYLVKRLEIEK